MNNLSGINESLMGVYIDATVELLEAMNKFPQPNYVITKVAEEVGEVVKAAVHCAEGRESYTNLRSEIVQAMAMLMRLYIEGDDVHGLESPMEMIISEEQNAKTANSH